MTFIVNVACDFGQGKINTGIEFPQRPTTLGDLVAVVEELYTAELRLQTGDNTAVFHCAVVLLLVDVYSDNSSERKGRWVEVASIEQVPPGSQLFVFDANSPPPSKGTIPKVQLVVTASQLTRFRTTTAALTTSSSGGSVSPPQQSSQLLPSQHRTQQGVAGGLNATPLSFGASRAAQQQPGYSRDTTQQSSSQQQNSSALPSGFSTFPSATSEDREELFHQLCRASGSNDVVAAHKLFAVLVENGLSLPGEQFTEITDGATAIRHPQWLAICDNFAPLIDALYLRLAAKAAYRTGEDAVQSLKDRLQELQDEEHRLLIRHATLREEIARATRDLREEEHRVKGLDVGERLRDWSMVQKYVSLKLRQNKLRKEEDQINRELMLL